MAIKSVKDAISGDLNERYQEPDENDCEISEISTVDVVDSSPSVVPPKKKKKIHPLKKMLGYKFAYLNCVCT